MHVLRLVHVVVSDYIIKMDYWNQTSTSRQYKGLSLGVQYRVFSSGIKKHGETKGHEIKSGEETGKEGVKEAIRTVSESKEVKEETKDGGGDTTTSDAGLHSGGDVGEGEREKREGSSPLKRKRDPTEQEAEQERSESVADGEQNGKDE